MQCDCLILTNYHLVRDHKFGPDWCRHFHLLLLLVVSAEVSEESPEHGALRSGLCWSQVVRDQGGEDSPHSPGLRLLWDVVGHLGAGVLDTRISPLLVSLHLSKI